jgi:hypothetical protein
VWVATGADGQIAGVVGGRPAIGSTTTIPEGVAAQRGYPQLTPEVKNKIFGENAARIFGIDIAAARQAIEGDLLYKLRDDRNPLPGGAVHL